MQLTAALFLFGIVAVQAQIQLNYPLNVEYDYNLVGNLDARGSNNGQRSSGALSQMTSVAAIQAVQQNADGSFLFVMNMFGTQVNVGQGETLGEMRNLEDDDDGLGANMYYQQSQNGEITQVWYQDSDSPYFVEVKLGAINSFHTHTLNVGQTMQVLESTVAGVHYSNYAGAGSSAMLTVNKQFTEEDFQSFSDPNVTPANVKIAASGSAGVMPLGYFQSTSINQMVLLHNAGATASDNNNNIMDMTMSSFGSLALALSANSLESPQMKKRFNQTMTHEELRNGTKNYKGSSTKDLAVNLIKKRSERLPRIQLEESLRSALESNMVDSVKTLNKVIRFVRASNSDVLQVVERFFKNAQFETDAEYRKKMLYVAASIPTGDYLMMIYGLESTDRSTFIQTLLASHSIQDASAAYLMRLEELAFGNTPFQGTQSLAILALGTLLGKTGSSGTVLLTNLISATQDKKIASIVNAIGNAGPSSVNIDDFPIKFLAHPSAHVRKAVTRALRKYTENPAVAGLISRLVQNNNAEVRREAEKILSTLPAAQRVAVTPVQLSASNLPFNKSWTGTYTLGGSEMSAAFQAELLLGTNFDCNQNYFNYEALAQATSTLSLFGDSKQAFDAEFVYGKINGAALKDDIFLQVWNDVLVDQAIPGVDCAVHSYPLGSFNQGIDDSYTLWVSVIPVVFTVTGSLSLELSWNWQICDSQLSAEVELVPTATFVIDGNAEVDLLIILAGINLSGNLNSQIIPQAYIHGTQCEIGMDVTEVSTPMAVELDSYYAWDSCKYWIFDCHWGQHNTQIWAEWTQPAIDDVLYNVDWKITP